MTRTLQEKAALIRAMLDLTPPAEQPALAVMTGLPGTGKTTFARALAEAGPFTLVGSDPVRAALFPSPQFTPQENAVVYEVADAVIWDLLREGRWVIYDATNLSEGRREMVRRVGLNAAARLVTVRTTAPVAVIKARLAQRAASIPPDGVSTADWSVYERLRVREQPVAHSYIEVDTTQDIAVAVREVVRRLRGVAPPAADVNHG